MKKLLVTQLSVQNADSTSAHLTCSYFIHQLDTVLFVQNLNRIYRNPWKQILSRTEKTVRTNVLKYVLGAWACLLSLPSPPLLKQPPTRSFLGCWVVNFGCEDLWGGGEGFLDSDEHDEPLFRGVTHSQQGNSEKIFPSFNNSWF